jgi:hypothetical protein
MYAAEGPETSYCSSKQSNNLLSSNSEQQNSSRNKDSVSRNLASKVDKPKAPVALSVQGKWTRHEPEDQTIVLTLKATSLMTC